jgi:hypothetical protein
MTNQSCQRYDLDVSGSIFHTELLGYDRLDQKGLR